MEHPLTRGRVQQLDQKVVNKIAAGEIIIAPANALKEMLENSIDAQSTNIDVIVKDGGAKLLQITDNGCGIDRDDLPILCKRFTTSKLTNFEDLNSIQTYGFRGEALASISHIAHLSVVTKSSSSPCAWKANYSDGELVPVKPGTSCEPKPVAGKVGTQISVEDLFFNVPSRLKALRAPGDEFVRVLDVIGRYSVHTENVGFSLKKFGDSNYSLVTRPNLSLKERIRIVFGSDIANSLVPLEIGSLDQYQVVNIHGQITDLNFNNKKSIQPVFFVNNRLVSNDPLKRAIYSTINHFLPKGYKPFVYLSIDIKPENVDVNVHPTKREVRFLYEDEIIDLICVEITKQFNQMDSTRNFQSSQQINLKKNTINDEFIPPSQRLENPVKKIRYDYNLVRTDASQSKITPFLSQQQQHTTIVTSSSSQVIDDEATHADVDLQSILELRAEIEKNSSSRLTELFANHIYVGIVDENKRLAALQYDVKLILFDYASILNEFFYQVSLLQFSNYGRIEFSEPIAIRELLGYVITNDTNSKPIDAILDLFESMSEMFEEYFNIRIKDGLLYSLPLIIKNFMPSLNKLPLFLFRMGNLIDYEDEKECLNGILKEIALFYIPEKLPNIDQLSDEDPMKPQLVQKLSDLNDSMENLLMPLIKKKFIAKEHNNNDMIEIANLPGLYKVFERC